MEQHRPLCLASTSPRRRALLEQFGLRHTTIAPDVDEAYRPGETPTAHVRRLAEEKARAARAHVPGHGVLAGDTVVVHEGAVLGKPADAADAERMLTALSGRTHQVISGYAVLDADSGEVDGGTVETRVTFRPLPPAWVRFYAAHPEAHDKAGAYGIQGLGGAMVERIEGSYTNVVGYPVETVFWALVARGWVSL